MDVWGKIRANNGGGGGYILGTIMEKFKIGKAGRYIEGGEGNLIRNINIKSWNDFEYITILVIFNGINK